MKKIIAKNEKLIQLHAAKNHVANTALTQARSLILDFMPIANEEEFSKSWINYVRQYIAKDKLLKHLDSNSLFNFNRLIFLEKRYKEYYCDPSNTCYDYIATKEEHLIILEYCKQLCTLLNTHPQALMASQHGIKIPLLRNEGNLFVPDLEEILL
jgi:hypothetical protein